MRVVSRWLAAATVAIFAIAVMPLMALAADYYDSVTGVEYYAEVLKDDSVALPLGHCQGHGTSTSSIAPCLQTLPSQAVRSI
jgi:hypothetical protein